MNEGRLGRTMKKTFVDIAVGIFLVIGFLALGWLALKLGEVPWLSGSKTYELVYI